MGIFKSQGLSGEGATVYQRMKNDVQRREKQKSINHNQSDYEATNIAGKINQNLRNSPPLPSSQQSPIQERLNRKRENRNQLKSQGRSQSPNAPISYNDEMDISEEKTERKEGIDIQSKSNIYFFTDTIEEIERHFKGKPLNKNTKEKDELSAMEICTEYIYIYIYNIYRANTGPASKSEGDREIKRINRTRIANSATAFNGEPSSNPKRENTTTSYTSCHRKSIPRDNEE